VQGERAWRRLLPAIAADVGAQPLLTPRDLRRIELPAMVVAGDRDPFVPVDHAWGISRLLPDGRLLIAPGSGHVVPVRRAGLFNEALAGFYRSTEAVARARARASPADLASLAHADEAPGAGPDASWLDERRR
jgi:pimeloyl-ACP methyl ester carboxylesterase